MYDVEYFTDTKGFCQVKEYIRALPDAKSKRIAMSVIAYLENLGPKIIGTDMDKRIDDDLRELRKGKHRILYARLNPNYLLLFAFPKSSQETPPKHIITAHELLNSYIKQKGIK